jgi:hypothetical protein
MKLKPNAIGISIKYYLTAIVVGGLLGIPAAAYGAAATSPYVPQWKIPKRHVEAMKKPVSKTRAEVLSQLRQAKRRGNYVINYATGETAYQANPSAFPPHPHQPGKTRAQVLRALKKAKRTGNYVINAETGRKANQTQGWG